MLIKEKLRLLLLLLLVMIYDLLPSSDTKTLVRDNTHYCNVSIYLSPEAVYHEKTEHLWGIE